MTAEAPSLGERSSTGLATHTDGTVVPANAPASVTEDLRLLLDNITEYAIFLMSPAGEVTTWSLGAERLTGIGKEQVLGQHFSILYDPDDVARGKPEHELEIVRRTGKLEEEGWRVLPNGYRFWASVVFVALRDQAGELCGYGKIVRDLSDRRRAEETGHELVRQQAARAAAESSEGELRHLSEHLEVLLAAERRHIEETRFLAQASVEILESLDCEATMERLPCLAVPTFADFCAVEVLDRGCHEPALATVDPAMAPLCKECLARHPLRLDDPGAREAGLEDGPIPSRYGCALRAGSRSLYPRDSGRARWLGDGRPHQGAEPCARGHHARLGAIRAPVRSGRTWPPPRSSGDVPASPWKTPRAYREAREAVSLRDDFLTIAGHEFRTPLTALLLQLTSLSRAFADGGVHREPGRWEVRAQKAFGPGQAAREARQRASRCVAHHRRSPRPRPRRSRPRDARRRGPRPPRRRALAHRLHGQARRRGQAARPMGPGASRPGCHESAEQRDQVRGEGSRSTCNLYGWPNCVRIEVRDQGIGIRQEDQLRIFGRFERAVSTRSYGGLGLGLWIVREIVEAHGGFVRVESLYGRGSTFSVELPV